MRFMATLCEGESVLMRNTVLLMLAAGCLRSVAAAQSTVEPGCDRPNSNAVACALRAGHVADLRDPVYASDERELRFWSSQDMLEPIALLVIQQRGNKRIHALHAGNVIGPHVHHVRHPRAHV